MWNDNALLRVNQLAEVEPWRGCASRTERMRSRPTVLQRLPPIERLRVDLS